MLSSRLPADLTPNAVSRAVEARRCQRLGLIDLTESNPTRAGFDYPEDLLAPLADAAALAYEPHALGLSEAREAAAAEFARHGRRVDPAHVVLTASTSEAYALLFKLCCSAGDQVLVPQPSYPLFDHLTRLEAVEASPYAVEYHGRWRIDVESLARGVTPRTRALLVVSPNNPTGSYLHRTDLEAAVALCRQHGLTLIGDEVFFDYSLDRDGPAVSVLDQQEVVACSLGGLSKSCGLPQLKLGWIAWTGPRDRLAPALSAYEVIADSYLSVSTPVQVAAPALLSSGGAIRAQIHARVARNLHALQQASKHWPESTVLACEGGWSAVMRVPAVRAEEELVVSLVTEDGVLVHPGYFFDFPHEAFLVVSLIVEPEAFDLGISRVLARASARQR